MALKLRAEIPLVSDDRNLLLSHSSQIQLNSQQIALRVTQQDLANQLVNYASITLLSNQIATRVSTTDFNGNTVASLINQSASSVKIQAEHIQLEGIITANGNVQILTDGSIVVNNGTFKGSILTDKDVSVGTRIKMTKIVVNDVLDLARESLGRNGISWGESNPPTTYPFAYITAFDAGPLANLNDRWTMVIKANSTIRINGKDLFIGNEPDTETILIGRSGINTSIDGNLRLMFGSTQYTITRDANGFLRAI